MSITQARLREVILAAQDFEQALKALHHRIEVMNELDPTPGLRTLAIADLASLLERPLQSSSVLAREAEQLRLTWHRNQTRNRKRQKPKSEDLVDEYIQWKQQQEGNPNE